MILTRVSRMGLTVWDASSSARTLLIMLVAVIIFLPVVLAYTAWVSSPTCAAKPGCTEVCAGVTGSMWYFSWILGLGLALTFGVLNAIWYEIVEDNREGYAGARAR